MPYQTVCKESELAIGDKKAVKIAQQEVILYRLEDGFYATESKCTHLFKSMKKGKIVDDKLIQCPMHRARFDIRTGEVVDWANFPPGIQLLNVVRSEKALKTYATRVENGEVAIDVG